MAKQAESRLQKNIQKALKKEVGGWWVKFWGGPFTPAGVPDLIGCVEGVFFALEVKLPNKRRSKTSDIQDETIRRIREEGGGVSTVVRSKKEAIDVVNKALEEAKEGPRLRTRER